MAITVRRLTYDDLAAVPQERPGDRHELFYGELVVSPSPAFAHQVISANIYSRLERFVQEGGVGRAFYAPIDVMIAPDTVLTPDIIYIARDRVSNIGGQTINEPPDLVIEILSPGSPHRDLHAKRDLYARFGVKEYWIVDPKEQSVTVLALTGGHYDRVPAGKDGSIRSRLLPDFTISLGDVFIDVPQERR
jgi:Uma2 family endonuclease